MSRLPLKLKELLLKLNKVRKLIQIEETAIVTEKAAEAGEEAQEGEEADSNPKKLLFLLRKPSKLKRKLNKARKLLQMKKIHNFC